MKKLLLIFLFLPIIGSSQTPVQNHGTLSVSGNRIIDQYGDTVSFAGGSLFWSNTGWGGEYFYNPQVVYSLHSNWSASIVRASMGVENNGGYLSDTTNKQRIISVVTAAINAGMYVIVDWHSHYAENYQQEAIIFFQEIATLFGGHPNIIYEIYNEPLQISWDNVIKPYAESVIAAIRAIDFDNLIVVGTPNWSQNVHDASNNPITGYLNIAYALHFYAGTHGQALRNNALTALNNGIALMVTEWGTVNSDGNGPVDSVSVEEWMTFLCNNNISHCNWAINDKNEGASALIPGSSTTGNWGLNDLTVSGILVKNILLSWGNNCNNSITALSETSNNKTTLRVINLLGQETVHVALDPSNFLGVLRLSWRFLPSFRRVSGVWEGLGRA